MRAPGVVATAGLGAAVLLATGLTVGLAVAGPQDPAVARTAPPVTSVPTSGELFDDGRQVPLQAVLAPTSALTLADTGRITATTCTPGGQIVSGSSLVTVDDRPTLALATAVPLWRDLDLNAKGADVTALQDELVRLGYDVTANGTYGPATRSAVKDLFARAGVVKPTGALPVASVVWLPDAAARVETCPLGLGAAASGGDDVATVGGGLLSATVTVPDGVQPGERVATFAGVSAPVSADGVITDEAFLDAVRTDPLYLFTQSADAPAEAGGLQVSFALAAPLEVTIVPPGAIYSLGAGTGCVDADGSARAVHVIASSLGKTYVTFDDGGAPPAAVDVTAATRAGTCR